MIGPSAVELEALKVCARVCVECMRKCILVYACVMSCASLLTIHFFIIFEHFAC